MTRFLVNNYFLNHLFDILKHRWLRSGLYQIKNDYSGGGATAATVSYSIDPDGRRALSVDKYSTAAAPIRSAVVSPGTRAEDETLDRDEVDFDATPLACV